MAASGFQKFTNSISDRFKEEMRTPLLNGEQILDSQGCNRALKGGVFGSIGGTIFFTNMRIIFETNKMNSKIKNVTDVINAEDIVSYAYADNGVVPMGGVTKDKNIILTTKTQGYNFTPQYTEKMVEHIKQICPQVVQAEKGGILDTMKGNIIGFKGAEQPANNQPATEPVKTPAPAQNVDVATEIKKYKELLDIGAITQEEYDAKKKLLLNL